MVVLPILFTISIMCVSPAYLKYISTFIRCVTLISLSMIQKTNDNIHNSQKVVSYPGPESVVLILLIARDIMIWISSIPSKFIFLMCRNIYILKVSFWSFGTACISCLCVLLCEISLWKSVCREDKTKYLFIS